MIGPVEVGGCKVELTAAPGTFATTVQISITAPSVSGVGDGGHRGYHAVCGIGVGIAVNGHACTGTFGHSLTLTISGFLIKPGERVALWNGTTFAFTGSPEGDYSAMISFKGSGEDFVVLAPGGGGTQPAGRGAAAASGSRHGARDEVLTSLFLAPAGHSPAGTGVLAPRWLTFISR